MLRMSQKATVPFSLPVAKKLVSPEFVASDWTGMSPRLTSSVFFCRVSHATTLEPDVRYSSWRVGAVMSVTTPALLGLKLQLYPS